MTKTKPRHWVVAWAYRVGFGSILLGAVILGFRDWRVGAWWGLAAALILRWMRACWVDYDYRLDGREDRALKLRAAAEFRAVLQIYFVVDIAIAAPAVFFAKMAEHMGPMLGLPCLVCLPFDHSDPVANDFLVAFLTTSGAWIVNAHLILVMAMLGLPRRPLG